MADRDAAGAAAEAANCKRKAAAPAGHGERELEGETKLKQLDREEVKLQLPRGEGLNIIALEGPGGVNKRSVLGHLQAWGYFTHSTKFIDFYAQHSRYRPNNARMGVRWSAACIDTVESLHRRFEEDPSAFRERVAFVNRSPVSATTFKLAYHPNIDRPPNTKDCDYGEFVNAARELPCRVVFCTVDAAAIGRTLAERYERAGPDERRLRDRLCEQNSEHREELAVVYKEMVKWSFMGSRSVLDTTDPEQAAAALLRWLGIAPPPFQR